MMGYGAGYGLGFGIGGWLWMIGCVLLVVGVVVLIGWLLGRATSVGSSPAPGALSVAPRADEALEALRLRFARGEIGQDEFLASKQALEATR